MEKVVFAVFSMDKAKSFIFEELFDCSLHMFKTFLVRFFIKTGNNFNTRIRNILNNCKIITLLIWTIFISILQTRNENVCSLHFNRYFKTLLREKSLFIIQRFKKNIDRRIPDKIDTHMAKAGMKSTLK